MMICWLRIQAYLSPADTLPAQLVEFRTSLQQAFEQMQAEAAGKLQTSISDPEANNGQLAQEINQRYGFTPQIAGLFDSQAFWCYLVLESAQQSLQIGLPENLDFRCQQCSRSFGRCAQADGERLLADGCLSDPTRSASKQPYMPAPPRAANQLRNALSENLRVIDTDLSDGIVPNRPKC